MFRSHISTSCVYFVFFLSGVAGLGYEIVWVRMFAVGLGHEVPSVLAVVAAFFGGFFVGAWALDRRVSRSRAPGRWYATLEILIGTWGVATVFLIPWANDQLAVLIGPSPSPLRHWGVAFVVPFVVLLPATAALGATLPAMDRFLCRLRADGRSVGGLYGVNTLGAVTGTLLSTFLLVPLVGFRVTLLLLATVNVFCAVAMLALARGETERPPVESAIPGTSIGARLAATVFLTGFLGIGYEVLGMRVMAQALENTVYSFAAALSVFLLGTAGGAAAYQALKPRRAFRGFLTYVIHGLSTACLLGTMALSRSGEIYDSVRRFLGETFAASVTAEFVLALLVFLLPSALMGATFSHLAQAARRERGGVGWVLGLNTLGGAIAPIFFGVLLVPALGARVTLLLLALGYLILLPEIRWRSLLPGAVPLALLLVFPSSLVLVNPPPGGSVLAFTEGVMTTAAVVDDPDGHRYLKVNDRFQMGGTGSIIVERRQAHIPLLLHPAPRRALFLGLGTGITFGAARHHENLRAEGVELLPEVLELMELFRDANGGLRNHRNLELRVADARRYIRASRESYDVIVADLFHPARDGAGSLYTLEHFLSIRERLAPGGLFCQWLPLYQLDLKALRLITRTFLEVFPEATAYLANFNALTPVFGLVGTMSPVAYPFDWFRQRVQEPGLVKALAAVGLSNDISFFGCLLGGKESLARWSATGPLNTDDKPWVMFYTPWLVYGEKPSAAVNLRELMQELHPRPRDVIVEAGGKPGREFRERVKLYRAARNLYLQGEILFAETKEDEALNAYLRSVRVSRDLKISVAKVLLMAQRRAGSDPAGAIKILLALQAADPSRDEVRILLEKLRKHLKGGTERVSPAGR